MDSDSESTQETDSSEEGEDYDLSNVGAAQTMVKPFTVKKESYPMVERGFKEQKLADTFLNSSGSGVMIPRSELQASNQPVQIFQQNIFQQEFGDVTVQGARNLTIGGTQNIYRPGPCQEEEKQLTWTEKIEKRTKARIDEWTYGMMKTSALAKIMDKLASGVTWLTIKGSPGEGKTTAAYMALEELQRSERQVFQVMTPVEFDEVTATCPKPVIMLDDIFGNLEFDQAEWSRWEKRLYQVLGPREHRSHKQEEETSTEKEVTVIIVTRDYVLNSASSDMGRISDYFTRDAHVVDMSNTVERSYQEKRAIWKVISEASGIDLDENTIDTICEIHVPHGFPHVCRLFATMHKEDANIDAKSFFKAPLDFLDQTVQKFMKDKVKLCLFKEMIKRSGSVNIRDLENVDNSVDIIDVANSLVGTYISEEDGNFTFNHPSIYDSVAFNLCKTSLLFVITNCHLSFIHERLRFGLPCNTQQASPSSGSNLVANIPKSYIEDLAKRFAAEITNRNLVLVLSHNALADELFIQELLCQVTLPLTELLKLEDISTEKSFLSLVASNKSPQLLKCIDNQKDTQLTESDINIVLYGVCQYAASDVLTYLVQTRDTLDINVRYEHDKTPLIIASYTRDSQFVQQLMSLDPDLNARDMLDGKTVLHYLCENGLLTSIEQMIDTGTDIDVNDIYERSPLWYACLHNQVEVVRLLLDRGARLDPKAIAAACSEGSLDVVMLIFNRGATVDMTIFGDNLFTAASWGGQVKVMEFLFEKGASVNTPDGPGRSPLHRACISNKHRAIQWLMEHGADIDIRDMEGNTPLHIAVQWGCKESVNALLHAGAVIDNTNNQGHTPLHKTVHFRVSVPDVSVCQTLLSHGSMINKQDTEGNTPLHLLCQVDSNTVLRKICQPASVHRDYFRRLVKLLVEHGAERNIKNNRGKLALHGWCKTLLD